MWLDSCGNEMATPHVDSNFDIMVWQPEITLTTQGDKTEIKWLKENKTRTSNENPLNLVKEIQQECFDNIEVTSNHLPFNGGSLGYFSYDLGRRFEVLPNKTTQDIATHTFVTFITVRTQNVWNI